MRCFDSDAGNIRATQMNRDGNFGGDDRIFIWIDTFHNQRSGYEFAFNAVGARLDALVENGRVTVSWDGIFFSKASIDEQGWVVEFQLPLKTIAFAPHATTWGLNITRFIRRKNEGLRWSYPYHNRTGRRLDVGMAFQVRPSPHFTASMSYSYTEVDLPQGSFETHVFSLPLNA